MATLFYRNVTTGTFTTAGDWKTLAGVNGTPANGDTLVFDRLSGNLNSTGGTLDQSALTPALVIVHQEYTGQIGAINATTGAPTWFQIGAAEIRIGTKSGQGSPSGCPLALFDTGSTTCVVNLHDSATTSEDDDRPPIQFKGSDLTINQTGGNAAIAPRDGETATVTLKVSNSGEAIQGAKAYLGRGATRTAVYQSGGEVRDLSEQAATLIEVKGGTYIYSGTGANTTIVVGPEGSLDYRGTGTTTTLRNSGSVDFSKDPRAKTVTNCEAFRGSSFNFANGVPLSITLTNGLDCYRCKPEEVTQILEPHVTISYSAV